MMRAVVLYEDSRGVPVKNFGLHMFVLAAAADRMSDDRWALGRAVKDRPLKGNGNLLKACREDPHPCPVIGVFDNDRIRELLKLPSGSCKSEVIAAVKKPAKDPARLSIVLLLQNTEDVLKSVAEHMPVAAARLEAALKKDLNARDAILNNAAADANPDLRAAVLRSIPSLDRVVRVLVEVLSPSPSVAP